MEAVILVIHLIIAVAIIAVVLLQPAEAGGFTANTGSMSNMMTPRRTADTMTRLTTILGGCFFVTSLLLAVIAGHKPVHNSILDAAPAVEKKMEQPATPAEPETPKAPIAK